VGAFGLLPRFCFQFFGFFHECRDDGLEHFERRVRPVLVERCYECHSSRSRRLKGGLSLESREGWERGGLSGAAVVPGDPDASLVVQAVRYTDEELQMPPAGRLPAAEVAALLEQLNAA